MRKPFITLLIGLLIATFLTGCVANFGGGRKTSSTTSATDAHPAVGQAVTSPTLGQQLIDLQKAKDTGAITDAEYQAQKAKLLENK
jgi:hypothetical protein